LTTANGVDGLGQAEMRDGMQSSARLVPGNGSEATPREEWRVRAAPLESVIRMAGDEFRKHVEAVVREVGGTLNALGPGEKEKSHPRSGMGMRTRVGDRADRSTAGPTRGRIRGFVPVLRRVVIPAPQSRPWPRST
jgi:hypothetical protein